MNQTSFEKLDKSNAILDDIINILIKLNTTVKEMLILFQDKNTFPLKMKKLMNNPPDIPDQKHQISQFIKECYPHYAQFLNFMIDGYIDAITLYGAQQREMYNQYQAWCREQNMLCLNRVRFHEILSSIGFHLCKVPYEKTI